MFAHLDEAGQRGFVDVTPEGEAPTTERTHVEVVTPELETTPTIAEHEPTGEPEQVETATETRSEQGSASITVPSATQPEPEPQPGLDVSVRGTSARGTAQEVS